MVAGWKYADRGVLTNPICRFSNPPGKVRTDGIPGPQQDSGMQLPGERNVLRVIASGKIFR
jgi:hypothetical protein